MRRIVSVALEQQPAASAPVMTQDRSILIEGGDGIHESHGFASTRCDMGQSAMEALHGLLKAMESISPENFHGGIHHRAAKVLVSGMEAFGAPKMTHRVIVGDPASNLKLAEESIGTAAGKAIDVLLRNLTEMITWVGTFLKRFIGRRAGIARAALSEKNHIEGLIAQRYSIPDKVQAPSDAGWLELLSHDGKLVDSADIPAFYDRAIGIIDQYRMLVINDSAYRKDEADLNAAVRYSQSEGAVLTGSEFEALRGLVKNTIPTELGVDDAATKDLSGIIEKRTNELSGGRFIRMHYPDPAKITNLGTFFNLLKIYHQRIERDESKAVQVNDIQPMGLKDMMVLMVNVHKRMTDRTTLVQSEHLADRAKFLQKKMEEWARYQRANQSNPSEAQPALQAAILASVKVMLENYAKLSMDILKYDIDMAAAVTSYVSHLTHQTLHESTEPNPTIAE